MLYFVFEYMKENLYQMTKDRYVDSLLIIFFCGNCVLCVREPGTEPLSNDQERPFCVYEYKQLLVSWPFMIEYMKRNPYQANRGQAFLPRLNSYTGFQLISESNSNCPLLHIALLQYIDHLILLVSCTFLTSPDNSDHLPHSSFLFPELTCTWASVLSLLLHPSFGMNSQQH